LNAKDYGIPQNRERVFTVSIRRDVITEGYQLKDYVFPEKQELKLRLKDLLEDEVDEKYYITDSMIDYLENGKYKAQKVSTKLAKTDSDICPTLDTMQGGNRQPFIKSKCKRLSKTIENTKFIKDEVLNLDLYNQTTSHISQTITEPHHNTQRLFDGLRIRKLTPKECWRLMGFTDEAFDKANQVNSNTQLYKQAGNSIVVNVLVEIFRNLL
jgi:DNA (cytosine-5)-methyltransferase 1